ncbi:MAG: hypothetical protein ACI9WC_001020 [Arenicella sp.]|jgi:hypothetical protein
MGRLFFLYSIYHQQLQDFISWYGPHTNVSDFSGRGLEFDIQKNISDTFSSWVNTAAHDSELEPDNSNNTSGVDDDNQILGSPVFTMNVGFDAELSDRFHLSGQIHYFADQATFDKVAGKFVDIDK